jgi:hypothetical protein
MSDSKSALRDVLWKMYQEHSTQGRHHETQRSTVAGALIAIASALVALITFDKVISLIDLPLTLLLLLLGGFGSVFSAKQYERSRLHVERARAYRDELDKQLDGAPLKRLKREADADHNGKYPRLSALRLNQFWIGLYAFIALLGAVLTTVAVAFPWKAS